MSEKSAQALLEISKKEGGLLAAFEACGRVIEDMKSDKTVLNIRLEGCEERNAELQQKVTSLEKLVSELEAELAKAKKELAKVKGGRNEW